MTTRSKGITVRYAALAVLVGGLWVVTVCRAPAFSLVRQDVSAMIALHQLHSVYPEAKQFRLEYLDDGWLNLYALQPGEDEVRHITEEMMLRQTCNPGGPGLAGAESSDEQTHGAPLPLNNDPAGGSGSPVEWSDK